MLKQASIAAIALAASLSVAANATTIPYQNKGTPAPANTFAAKADGTVTAYFFGTDAGYTSRIGLWADGLQIGGYGLQNHTSTYGQPFQFGEVKAGQSLVFELQVLNTRSSWYSLASSNSDKLNHTYSTNFMGDKLIPMGTYIAFEDLPNLGDIDYNDHQFVMTNITNAKVPEPLTLALFGLGIVALGFARKRAA